MRAFISSWRKTKILVLFIIMLVTYVSFEIYSFSKVAENVRSDAAIVLGAAIWDDKPSPVFEDKT